MGWSKLMVRSDDLVVDLRQPRCPERPDGDGPNSPSEPSATAMSAAPWGADSG